MTAAAAGAGAPVVEYRPQDRLLVIGYIEGRTFGAARTWPARRTSRASPRPAAGSTRAPGSATTSTCSTSSAGTCRWPGPAASRSRPATTTWRRSSPRPRRPWPSGAEGTVPCNNDLLPANLIDDGERIWLIDYELSGNNDACFELGNIAAEAHLDTEALERPGHRLLRQAAAQQDRPGLAARRPGRHVRVDAVGRDPERREPASTTTSGPGPWSASRARPAASPPASFKDLLEDVQRDD